MFSIEGEAKRVEVLIETSWNVKDDRGNNKLYKKGINRNIVECKDECIYQEANTG